ncbi:MAG: cytochrome c [Betaproteobacteria bacterium]|nr:cytochrome c [Betaproteobacteria bacterium]
MRPAARRRASVAIALVLLGARGDAFAQGNARNGLYISKAAGCVGCHTDTRPGSSPFAGGRAIDTPFGTFYGSNLTPHRENGLGKWSEEDFRRAIRLGERPDGTHYFPAFPYASFTGMTDGDVRDLWAYLKTLPTASTPNRPHELRFPFSWRFLVTFWKWLYYKPGALAPTAKASAMENRGMYLIRTLGHCGECHTPRNTLGGPKSDRFLAGGKLPEGRTPNLTPTRLKKWSDADLVKFFKSGTTPAGDLVADNMGEVVQNSTSQLSSEDVAAMIAYLRSLPAQPEETK